MNWAQFKDSVFNMCRASAVVASLSLTHDVAGWQCRALLLYSVMTNIFVTEFTENISLKLKFLFKCLVNGSQAVGLCSIEFD